MKTSFPWKAAVLLFVGVLAAYLGVFHGIEYARQRKGPWEADFSTDSQGRPFVIVSQQALKISSVTLQFSGERIAKTNLSAHVHFDRPKKAVPFGKVIYEDLTFLPGVVTFDFFGHEVEFLPRVLIVNKREVPWKSGSVIELSATNKPPTPPRPAKGYE